MVHLMVDGGSWLERLSGVIHFLVCKFTMHESEGKGAFEERRKGSFVKVKA